jgi:hypothetical protein
MNEPKPVIRTIGKFSVRRIRRSKCHVGHQDSLWWRCLRQCLAFRELHSLRRGLRRFFFSSSWFSYLFRWGATLCVESKTLIRTLSPQRPASERAALALIGGIVVIVPDRRGSQGWLGQYKSSNKIMNQGGYSYESIGCCVCGCHRFSRIALLFIAPPKKPPHPR